MRKLLLLLLQFSGAALLAQPGTLDISFAGNGKKQTANPGGAMVVAVQPADQKILVAGGNTIVRYTTTGPLDTQFGNGGIVTLNYGSASVRIHALAVQPDGMIVCAGTYIPVGTVNSLFITRLRSDGTTDGTFNNIGFNTLPNYDQVTSDEPDGATGVALQSDGKIVVCGEYMGGHDNKRGPFYFGVARFLTTGQLDNGFGTGGQVITNPGSLKNVPRGLAITSADKIVVCGYRKDWFLDGTTHSDSVLVIQYTRDGVPDAANFGTGGIARFSVGSNRSCRAHAITLQPDGRILLAGYYLNNGVSPNFLILRLNTNGSADNSFAGNGKLGVPFENTDYAYGIGVEPGTGAVVAAGITTTSLNKQFAICRVSPAGVLDNGFGAGGQVIIPWTTAAPIYSVANLAIQSNGRIVVTGTAQKPPPDNAAYMATIRLLSSGFNPTAIDNDTALVNRAAALSTRSRAGLQIYPNPAATQLQVTGLPVDAPVLLTVTGMGGQILLQQRTGQGNTLLDISRLAPGTYVLTVTSAEDRHSLPFVKTTR